VQTSEVWSNCIRSGESQEEGVDVHR